MSGTPTADEMHALLSQWGDWMAARTDAMMSLEQRVRTAGSAEDDTDLAAAFVARKALADRLQAISDTAEHDRKQAAQLAIQPVVDDLGGPVGNNLANAAALVDAIVTRVEQRVSSTESRLAAEVGVAAKVDSDLAIAERLANQLGSHVNRVAQLRDRSVDHRSAAALADEAARLRSELEAADAERRQTFAQWTAVPERLAELSNEETAVRQLAERCRVKIANAPSLGVPAVAAVGDLPSIADLEAMPWAAARATMTPILVKVERLHAAFAEAGRRFRQPLDDRDDQRGLLQAFRDKAAEHGFGESADVEPLYRQAESVLWAAPCDLASARPLVERYVAAVNALISAAVSSKGAGR
jgi:hypothetical protein